MTYDQYQNEHGNDNMMELPARVGVCAECGEDVYDFDRSFRRESDAACLHKDCFQGWLGSLEIDELAEKLGFITLS